MPKEYIYENYRIGKGTEVSGKDYLLYRFYEILPGFLSWLTIILAVVFVGLPATVAEKSSAPVFDYPAPRYPQIPDITKVEQLLPYVRRVMTLPMPYSGDQRPGRAAVLRPEAG